MSLGLKGGNMLHSGENSSIHYRRNSTVSKPAWRFWQHQLSSFMKFIFKIYYSEGLRVSLSSGWPQYCRRGNIQHARGPHRPFCGVLPGTKHDIQISGAGRDPPPPYKPRTSRFPDCLRASPPPASRRFGNQKRKKNIRARRSQHQD